MVQICLLGGVSALGDDGAALDVGPAKCQALLAALALSPGAPVPVSRLVERVWGADPPRTAEKTLQSYVARLRKSLGAGAIARVGAAYRLDVDPEAVDAVRFERRLQEGDLPAALAEWNGEPLAGLDAEGLAPSAAALAERHLAAIETVLERAVDDDPVGAVGELTELTARHPFREGLWVLLMTALYRCGRPADALAAYRRARGHMVGELGIEPGPRLRELEAMVLGHDERLGVAVAERPAAAASAPAPVDPTTLPVARPAERGNLPRRGGRLVGREDAVAAVAGALVAAPVVTLVGPGGIGKSALAVAAARAAEPDLAGGAWLVELAEVSDSGDVPRAAADALGVRESPGRGLAAAVVSALASRHALLVLDNCEHVVEGAAALARAVSEGCPDARVLATSREGLAVAGERVLPVDPLDPAGAAVELFTERAAAAGAVDVDAASEEVEEICRILDGVPLAIELAAARARSLSPRELADRLHRDLRLLGGGRRPGPLHHRTLDAAIAWSYGMLSHAERILFARLSVFAGPFDAAAAEHVGAGGDLDALDVADVLGGLVERSMVIAAPGATGRRLRMLEPIRRFAAERLVESGEHEAARAGHARWCRGETERIRGLLAGRDESRGVAALDALWPDLRVAVERACAAGDAALACGLVGPVATELLLRTRTEIGEWAERILAAADEDVEAVAFALSWAGQRHLLIQDREGWERLAARHGAPSHVLVRHARAFLHEDYPALLELAPALASWLRARGDDHAAEFADMDVGAALLNLGRLDEHDAVAGSLVERWRMKGPPTFLNWGLMLLGYSARFAGDTARAERLFAEAVSVAVPPGTYSPNRPVEAGVAFRRGDRREAARLLLSHVEELIDAGTAFGGDIAAVEFVAIADGSGRCPEAARILGWLATTNLLDAPGFRAMVADLEASVAADATLAAARSEGEELRDSGALELMRATLAALAADRDDEAGEG